MHQALRRARELAGGLPQAKKKSDFQTAASPEKWIKQAAKALEVACSDNQALEKYVASAVDLHAYSKQSNAPGELLSRVLEMSHGAAAASEDHMKDAITRSQPCVVLRAQGLMISRATMISNGVYQTAKHCLVGVKGRSLGPLKQDEKFVILLGKHVWAGKVLRLAPDAAEQSTNFVDGVVLLSTDNQYQVQGQTFAHASKVSMTGATSKGVLAQGTIVAPKENAAEVVFVTHPRPANWFAGNSGSAYNVVGSAGSVGAQVLSYAVHCGIGANSQGAVGVAAILKNGVLPHVLLTSSEPASEAEDWLSVILDSLSRLSARNDLRIALGFIGRPVSGVLLLTTLLTCFSLRADANRADQDIFAVWYIFRKTVFSRKLKQNTPEVGRLAFPKRDWWGRSRLSRLDFFYQALGWGGVHQHCHMLRPGYKMKFNGKTLKDDETLRQHKALGGKMSVRAIGSSHLALKPPHKCQSQSWSGKTFGRT